MRLRIRVSTAIKYLLLLVLIAGLATGSYWLARSGALIRDRIVDLMDGHPNPLIGKNLYVFPDNYAQKALQGEREASARLLIREISERPVAQWYGQWLPDVRAAVQADMARAGERDWPVLVVYNVPYRDCGQHSAGGAGSAAAYRQWVDQFSAGVGARPAIVIVEPDALPQIDCVPPEHAQERYDLLNYAIAKLSANPQVVVYLDGGNARWGSVDTMASRLRAAGVAEADGFSVNVSNYYSDAESLDYARKLSRVLDGKHFVIDSSRNGNGPLSQSAWCNPAGRALGTSPAVVTSVPGLDAYLWIKQPGTSDGTCNGGPAAGQWWRQSALELAKNSR